MDTKWKTTLVLTLFQLILGGMMLGYGISYQEDCNNGATNYLFTGGAIIIAANILPFIMAILRLHLASCCDISKFESYEDKLDFSLFGIHSCLSLVSFGVTIWVGKVLHRNFKLSGRSLSPIVKVLLFFTVLTVLSFITILDNSRSCDL